MTAQLRESTATIRWLTNPPQGEPRLTVGSHSFPAVALNVNAMAPDPLASSPGELIAGAFGSVFAWLLADELMRDGAQAHELVIEVGLTAEITAGADHRDPAVCGIHCHAEARVPGVDAQRLQAVCEAALGRCARAIGLREDIAMRVDSTALGS